MKEAIEELIERYEKRANTLLDMAATTSGDVNKVRLTTKRNVYRTVVDDLKQLLEDEQDKA